MTDRTLVDGLARALADAAQTLRPAGNGRPRCCGPTRSASGFRPSPICAAGSPRAALRSRLRRHTRPDDGHRSSDLAAVSCGSAARRSLPAGPAQRTPEASALTVILLPGVSWRALREPMTLDRGLQALVEMQYRGDVFRQRRQARDWTVATFLRDPDQGLGLDVATDSRTDEAARRALPGLLDLNLEAWRARPLGAEDFNKVAGRRRRARPSALDRRPRRSRSRARRPAPGRPSATSSSANTASTSTKRARCKKRWSG